MNSFAHLKCDSKNAHSASPKLLRNYGQGTLRSVFMDLVYSIHVERARKILSIAALNVAEVVILGAFGCGAFKNSPSDVARAYATVLPEFIHNFETIEFAVNKSEINNQNHEVFSKMFYRFSERFVGESL